MAFHVGQRVVCVEAEGEGEGEWIGDEAPIKGTVYTVSRFYMFDGLPTVWLQEIRRGYFARWEHGNDVGYGAYRFRPLSESRLDQFRAHLAPTPKERVSA